MGTSPSSPSLILLISFLAVASGCSDDQNFATGFILYNGTFTTTDANGEAVLELAIADGEEATISIGAEDTSRSISGRSYAEVLVVRDRDDLKVLAHGQGGEPLIWKNKTGPAIECTKTIKSSEGTVTFTYRLKVLDSEQPG